MFGVSYVFTYCIEIAQHFHFHFLFLFYVTRPLVHAYHSRHRVECLVFSIFFIVRLVDISHLFEFHVASQFIRVWIGLVLFTTHTQNWFHHAMVVYLYLFFFFAWLSDLITSVNIQNMCVSKVCLHADLSLMFILHTNQQLTNQPSNITKYDRTTARIKYYDVKTFFGISCKRLLKNQIATWI